MGDPIYAGGAAVWRLQALPLRYYAALCADRDQVTAGAYRTGAYGMYTHGTPVFGLYRTRLDADGCVGNACCSAAGAAHSRLALHANAHTLKTENRHAVGISYYRALRDWAHDRMPRNQTDRNRKPVEPISLIRVNALEPLSWYQL